MTVDYTPEDNDGLVGSVLREQRFIGTHRKYEDTCRETWKRLCINCFYRGKREAPKPVESNNCAIVPHEGEKTPHELFGVEARDFLPLVIDSKEVGNYCPHFLAWTAE